MKAVQAMTRNVVVIREEDSLEVAFDLMKEWDIRHLPVVKAGLLVGVLSDRDILPFTKAKGTEGGSPLADLTVRETMTRRPVTCSPTQTIGQIAGLMLDHKIDFVPVVEDADQELVGLITSTDLLDLLREREVLDATRTVPWSYAVRMLGREQTGYL